MGPVRLRINPLDLNPNNCRMPDMTNTEIAKSIVRQLAARRLTSFEFDGVAELSTDYGVWVERISKTSFKVVFNGMYDDDFDNYSDTRPFTIETLDALSEVFKTKNINIGQRECHGSGCESCGYGGRYSLDIYVHDVEPNTP